MILIGKIRNSSRNPLKADSTVGELDGTDVVGIVK